MLPRVQFVSNRLCQIALRHCDWQYCLKQRGCGQGALLDMVGRCSAMTAGAPFAGSEDGEAGEPDNESNETDRAR
jgi:hypothetical protein